MRDTRMKGLGTHVHLHFSTGFWVERDFQGRGRCITRLLTQTQPCLGPAQSRLAQISTTTITMAHRVLAIDEILREVASCVTDIHPSTTVALACCAKSFEEPALNELWKIQDELPTLIKTLPPDCWELHIGEAEDNIVRDLPQLRWCFALLEDSQLRRDCDLLVFGVDARSDPVEG